jgi:hypothetical protein
VPVQSKLEKISIAQNVIRGIKKTLAPGEKRSIGGVVYTREELIARYEDHLAKLEAIRQAWAAWQEALAAERSLRKPMTDLTYHLKQTVHGRWGVRRFGDFGWEVPKKPGPKTVKAKLAGVEKRRKNKR